MQILDAVVTAVEEDLGPGDMAKNGLEYELYIYSLFPKFVSLMLSMLVYFKVCTATISINIWDIDLVRYNTFMMTQASTNRTLYASTLIRNIETNIVRQVIYYINLLILY